jgi:hypothetical protein
MYQYQPQPITCLIPSQDLIVGLRNSNLSPGVKTHLVIDARNGHNAVEVLLQIYPTLLHGPNDILESLWNQGCRDLNADLVDFCINASGLYTLYVPSGTNAQGHSFRNIVSCFC